MVDRSGNQKKYWDGIASIYDSKYGYQTDDGRNKLNRKVDKLVRIMGLNVGDKVLELGCGTGAYTRLLNERGFNVTGLDISENMLKQARLKNSDISLVRGDIHNIPFGCSHFDAVIGFYILHYADVIRVLDESYRVLVVGGKVGFVEPNLLNPIVFAKTKVGIVKKVLSISSEATSFSGFGIKRIVGRNFSKVKIAYSEYGFLSPVSNISFITPFAGSIIVKGDKI